MRPDIAPNGTASSINGEIAPVRITDVSVPLKIAMPAIVHRFPRGHSIGLVISGGSPNYRGNLLPSEVTIKASNYNVLSLPVVK